MVRALVIWLLLAAPAFAAPSYAIVPEKSSLTFEVIENGAKVSGKFTSFSGDVTFDPRALEQSRIKVEVTLSSVASDTEDMAATLAEPDWFDVAKFPKAVFESANVKSLGGNRYEATGTLTIKGVSQPLSLLFTLTSYDAKQAAATGTASMKRTAFTVGWSDTGQVEDTVNVAFSVIATAR